MIPAKIAPGYFYIALDNLPTARERNVELLRTSKYVDIPIEYVTGRRALVSLEKGVTGERVFAQALAAWEEQDRLTRSRGAASLGAASLDAASLARGDRRGPH